MQWAAIAAALAAALGFAINTSLQHHGATQTTSHRGPAWWARLLSHPIWLAGSTAGLLAIVLQALALALGPVAIVQPILTTALVFALPATALLQHRRPARAEWAWAGLLLAALIGFLLAAHPEPGPATQLSHTRLLATTLAGLVLAAGLAVPATRRPTRYRAALLGAATGIGFGITSMLGKYCLMRLAAGPLAVLADWPVWTLLTVALGSVAVEQAAFHAGPLAASLPPLTILDPLAATIGSVIALNETLHTNPTALLAETLAALALLLATTGLAHHMCFPRFAGHF